MPVNDDLRTLIGLLVQASFPVGQIFNLWSFTGDEVATIMAFIGIALTIAFRLIRTGQTTDEDTLAKLVNAEIARRVDAGLLLASPAGSSGPLIVDRPGGGAGRLP